MALPSRTAVFDMAPIVEALIAPFRTGMIEIYDPAIFTVDKPYDFTNGTGGVKTHTVLWGPVKARIQQTRLEELQLAKDEWGTKRAFYIGIPLAAGMPQIHRGLRIRVTSGGNDPTLTNIALQVDSAVQSNLAHERGILAVTEEAPLV